MSESQNNPIPGQPGGEVQRFAHSPTSARIPEKVGRGVTATGVMAFFGPNEFVVDFLQVISRPAQLIARVVMTPAVAEQFVNVLRENFTRYTATFGQPPAFPKPPQPERPHSAQEVYDELKIPEEVLSGVYANTVLVGHTPAEFGIDFITGFIPHAAVSARVYISAPRVPQVLDTLNGLVTQYKKQHARPAFPASPAPPQNPPPTSYGSAPGIPGFPTPEG